MNVRKRRLALLMCICMIFTLLPFSALADATAQDGDIVYGKYDNTGWNEDKALTAENSVKHYPASGETSDSKANIDYSKTAVKNNDGSYNVTLTIKSTTKETPPGASAVVLVIDNSNSMTDDRLNSAKAAAKAFVDSYGKSGSGRYIALVSFATYAKKYDFGEGWWPWSDKVYWLDASNTDNRRAINASIDKMGRYGGTNLEQGLSTANDLFKDNAISKISKSNKYVIALTDGEPTLYGTGLGGYEGGTGNSCNETTYKRTIAAADTLKKTAEYLYTVCYGAENETIDYSKETVGDFLANRIASSGKAYNATDSGDSLSKAFAKIYESIKKGISSGFTVTDPMGEYVNLVSDSLTGDGYSVSGSTITWEPKNGTTVDNPDGSKTTTYTLTYKVTLGEVPEDGTYPLNEDTTLAFMDGETAKTLHFNVPGIYREAPRYTVTYQYTGDVPEGAIDVTPLGGSYKKDATVTVADKPSVDGWTFSGWSVADNSPTTPTITDGKFNMPNGNVVLEGSWTKLEGYTVKYMWGDKVLDTKAGAALAVGMNTPNESPKSIEGYTPKPTDPKSITISTDPNENVIIFEYYKNVTLTAKSNTVTYNGKEQTVSGFTGAPEGADFSAIKVGAQGTNAGTYDAVFDEGTVGTADATGKYIVVKADNGKLEIARANVTVTAKSYEIAVGSALPKPEADVSGLFGTDTVEYTISGMPANSDASGTHTLTPSGDPVQGNYNVNYKPGTLTIYDTYTVTYNYECTDGSSVPETVTAPVDSKSPYRAGSSVTVLNAPTDTIDGYIFDGWYKDGTKIAAGATFTITSDTVIIGKWKPVTGLTCTINYIWNGNKTKPIESVTIDGLTYNETITKSPKNIPGFTPVSEESKNCVVKKDGNVINFYYYMNVKLVAEDDSTIYNGKDYTANVNYDVVTKVNNKDFKLSGVEFKGVKATVTEQNAGSYSIPFNIDPVKDKTVDTNEYYLVTEVVAGTLTIARANVTVTAKSYEIAVGSELPEPEADVRGLFGTDKVEYTISGMPENSNTAGTHTLTPSGKAIQGNYNVTYETGTLTIYDTYTVTYNYECTDGSSVPETVTAPVDSKSPYRAGSSVTVLNAPTDTIDGYIFDGWYKDGTKIAAGATFTIMSDTVIIGKWAPADTTYTIECYWGYDNQNRLPADTDGQEFHGKVGQKIKLIDTPTITGYTACMSDVIKLKASGNVLKVYYLKNVTITPGNATVTYDGKEHFVNTFSATTIDGDATETMAQYIYAYVAGTNAGVYPVGVFQKASEVNPLAATDEVPAAIALNVNDQIGGLYCVTEIGEGNLTINRAKVTVTADDKSKYVGEKDPDFTAKVVGLVKGESESLIDYTIKRDPGEKAGTYKIIPVGAKEQGNYEVTFKEGTLTIKSRPVNPGIYTEIIVEITGNSDSVVYDGTEHSVKDYTVKISDPRYTEADFTFTGKAEASGINAGTYEMGLKAEQFRNTNALFRNVKFVIKADGVLTITPKDLTITAGSKTEYGPTPVTCDEWTVSGLAAGDKVESVKITGIQSVPGSSPNVPSDAVIKNAKGEDVTKNYAIKYVNGTLTMLEVLNKEDHFNYIIGTPEGLSLPTANVTRAEVATIFFRLMTDDARAKFDSLDNNFSDVAKGQWYNRAISTLANAGIIKGDPAGTYRPGDPITRAEMATIIARFGDFKEGGKTFNDISGHWAQKYIELAASNGWINGNPDGTFKPNNNITRAETVAMINRVLDRQTKDVSDLLPVSQMTNWSDNMDTAKWYYRDMQEATNNHKAERVGNSIYEKWTEKLPDIDWASYQI